MAGLGPNAGDAAAQANDAEDCKELLFIAPL
jgi:hypothetical protein